MKKWFGLLLCLYPISSALAQQEWKANLGLSGVLNTGNSVNQTIGGTSLVSFKENNNQVTWTGSGAYGRARDNSTGITTTNTKNWLTNLRYDRFLSEQFSVYTLGKVSQDQPAGFDLTYGGSTGYAHIFYKTDPTSVRYELGFDYTRQEFVTDSSQDVYAVRLFLQLAHKFSESASITQDIENLFNVAEFQDYRLNTLTALNFKIASKVAFQTGYSLRLDNQPVPGFKKVDTTTQLGLNISFL